MSVELKFCGAAGVVTGSSYLLQTPKVKFLIDCGLFQGTKTVRELNYGDFPFNPAEISFVLLTHAHIDHSGLLPKLVNKGFKGKIYTSEATKDLLAYMLPDSANIQETEVKRLNEKNRQRGLKEVEPIYTFADADAALKQIEPVKIDGWLDMPMGVKARFWNAGHILGSASIELKIPAERGGEVHMLFSGDLGPDNKSFHNNPESPKGLDYVVVESTYGDRERKDGTIEERRQKLRREILQAVEARGNILIPAFAVERTQELLLDLDVLADRGEIPALPLFIDSPLATKVTSVFEKHLCELEETSGKDCPFHGKNVRFTQSVEESKGLNRIKSGAIIMAASGMCDAGRIRHHLLNNLWNKNATVLFAGYQAEGTLGKFIQGGTKRVRIHGQEVDVNARIRTLEGYSAHADQGELMAWVKERLPVRKNIFLTHGTEDSRAVLEQKLAASGVNPALIVRPLIDDLWRLDTAGGAEKLAGASPARITPETLSSTDWHNDYARFVLDLAQHLRGLKDSSARHALLNDLMRRIAPKNGKNGNS